MRLTVHSQRLRLFFSILLVLISGALILAHFRRAPSEAATVVQAQGRPGLLLLQDLVRVPMTVMTNNPVVETMLITVTPTGFEPAELTRAKGRFLLAIDNQSGLDEVEFYFERETGRRVNVPLSRRGKIAWREIVDLTPGTYILRATNDESWRCRITITAQ